MWWPLTRPYLQLPASRDNRASVITLGQVFVGPRRRPCPTRRQKLPLPSKLSHLLGLTLLSSTLPRCFFHRRENSPAAVDKERYPQLFCVFSFLYIKILFVYYAFITTLALLYASFDSFSSKYDRFLPMPVPSSRLRLIHNLSSGCLRRRTQTCRLLLTLTFLSDSHCNAIFSTTSFLKFLYVCRILRFIFSIHVS